MLYVFNMIFAFFTKGYLNSENEDTPVLRGIGIIVIIQIGITMVIQELINNRTCFLQKLFCNNEFNFIVGEIILFFILNIIYFTEKRVSIILSQYEEMTQLKKKFIQLLGLILLILPLIIYMRLPNNCA